MGKQEHIYSIDYYAYKSPLRKYNATFKFIFVILVLLLSIVKDSLYVSIYIIFSMSLINIFKNKITVHDYFKLLSIPIMFILFGCIAIAIEIGYGQGHWYINVTKTTIIKSIHVMLRTFGAVNTLYFLTISTPINEIISILRKIHVPKVITELMNMIYRYIFILMDVQYKLKNASESRLGYVDFKTSCYTFGSCMGNLIILSFKKAGMYYDALEARCYNGEMLFLEEYKKVRILDILIAALYILSIIIIKVFL